MAYDMPKRSPVKALMVDVDGVLVCGRPADGKPWVSALEADLGLKATDLHQEFFAPYWSDIVLGRHSLAGRLEPVLAKMAPHLACEDFIAYWFENDSRLNLDLLAELDRQREAGVKIFLATNQEHLRASYLMERLGLNRHCDGIYYSAALGCRKPDSAFFGKAAVLSGFSPEQLVLIDDAPANVSAARELGWQAIEWREGDTLTGRLAELRSIDS